MKKRISLSYTLFAGLLFLISCSKNNSPLLPEITMDIPSQGYEVAAGDQLSLVAQASNADGASYRWTSNGQVVSQEQTYNFSSDVPGVYQIGLNVATAQGAASTQFKVTVTSSPYITKVFEYQYGPGQHASILTTSESNNLVGSPWADGKSFVHLGGWGGYIVAGFDHKVKNRDGYDFAVYAQPGASSEPGVVYVMKDTNGNGKPDDGNWLQLKGSEYDNAETVHNYEVTYYKPANGGNVTWEDNQGNTGELVPNYGTDSWWWAGYGDKTEVNFNGERLPDAYVNTSTNDSTENWALGDGLFAWGYAETYNNQDYDTSLKANRFDISNAVNADGPPANLDGIDFIKVQSSVFQISGWLNEVSTEVSGAADLNMLDNAN
ncbi:PKD-like domain-containing protein [Prolixibacter sp. SD074]|uniref:PKD-like domain-containing protein n=1 Tax=Prolixibacter sp. SD074 TaxID=2652391 RepID=UPI00129946E1|nr:PKD-like domain-containing protein [Prolixibacter sp. SD074]